MEVEYMAKPTRKAIENRIKDCIRNNDIFTAENYYNNYKEQFKDLDLNKLIDEVNKSKIKPKKEDSKENKESKQSKKIMEDE